MLIKRIKKTEHYIRDHQNHVPWSEVVKVVLTEAGRRRKKGNKIEIETDTHYILCELKKNTLWIINAKRK